MFKGIALALGGLLLCLTLIAAAASGPLLALAGGPGTTPSKAALRDIPGDYLLLYRKAAPTCPGLDWSVLAAIGKVESNHGRSTLPGVHSGANPANARGPMQFLPATFRSVIAKHPPPGGAQTATPYDPEDAIFSAAAYLCDSGARDGKNLQKGIYAYNHSTTYVTNVLAQASAYRSGKISGGDTAASTVTLTAIEFAQKQLGDRYVFGGDGPHEGGWDCSGLTKAAYAAAGVKLPRTADAQFRTGPRVPRGEQLRPGDLAFYGSPGGTIHHVGLVIGRGQLIEAPKPGTKVRIGPILFTGADFAGATRPADLATSR
ncbi:NlpC/P60 family protein [Streptomyces boninensis]|uniref:C40 family peptidase n=1 Tax=Streptomyces boninensis TaxID=2039455 RepID=UPI003B20E73C